MAIENRRGPKVRVKGRAASLVRFFVGDTCYAFEVAAVEEVANVAKITTLPEMGVSVAGVTDHRGRVIPIVDLRPRFGLPPAPGLAHQKWILMRSAHGLVGFIVDQVRDVVAAPEVIESPPNVGGAEHVRGVRGVVNVDDELVFVLDEDKLASVVANLDLADAIPVKSSTP